ncbi:MAG: glycine cleavage system protein GcvH [Caldicoprobacterales bacterium]|jgi:glycine cleavage system H protein|nr:glycine cleavage system protein GcvH [Clostridiales bacterium]
MRVLQELLYTKEHEWVKIEGRLARVGITDYAQSELGDVVYLELPEIDAEFNQGDPFGVVESVKAASDLYAPLTGKVVDVNDELTNSPEAVNEDPYGSWMIVLEISDESELNNLLSSKDYEELCSEED